MLKLLETIVAFIVALGVLIVIHELGHYLVARMCRVKVLKFSLGFGKPLFSRRLGKDNTEWIIAAIPFGGYVSMLDEREGPVTQEELPRAFNRQSVFKRFIIVLAGPLANFLLAIAFYWFLFMHGVPGEIPMLGTPLPNTPAAHAGFTQGEVIKKVAGEEIGNWQDARWILLKEAIKKGQVKIEVHDESGRVKIRNLDLTGLNAEDLDNGFQRKIGLVPFPRKVSSKVDQTTPNGVAHKAGVQPGDTIVAVNSSPVVYSGDVVKLIGENPNKPIILTVQRGTTRIELNMTPHATREGERTVGRIGVVIKEALQPDQPNLYTTISYGPLAALEQALSQTGDMALFSLKMLGKMVVGEISLKNLGGPITIADYAGQSAQISWIAYISFLALLSISLGVLNLLPIPVLDGGHLLYYTIEIIKRRPVSEKAMAIGQRIGMALLFTLMTFAIFNDINRLFGG